MDKKDFLERLKRLVSEKGFSQGNFSKMLGLSERSMASWLVRKQIPDVLLAAKMAKILGVTLDKLVADEEPSIEISENNAINKKVGDVLLKSAINKNIEDIKSAIAKLSQVVNNIDG